MNAGPGVLAVLDAVINTLWQAVFIAALVWGSLRFSQRIFSQQINAATRHAIWWATLAVVLILPCAPAIVMMLRSHPALVSASTTVTRGASRPALEFQSSIIRVIPEPAAKWPLVILSVWAAILLWRVFQILRSYVFLRGLKRRANVSAMPLPVNPRRASLLVSAEVVSPMAVGFLHPAVVLPEALLGDLTDTEREHVLLHEAAHLAGYDDWSNLAMRLLGGALALHPVAIWILRRIEREREIACDDWVVARTGAARPYAESLAHLFELREAKRSEMLASGIFGSHSRLGNRVEILLRRGRTFSPKTSPKGVATSALALAVLMLAGSLMPRWIVFAQQPQAFSFEVASIHSNNTGAEGSIVNFPETGRLSVTNASLKTLVRNAYGVQNDQIAGGPAWLDRDRYDIQAKTAGQIREEQEGPLIQDLLASRFHLKVRWETRELPVYVLAVGQGGPKFKQSEGPNGSMRQSRGSGKAEIAVTRVSMSQLAGMLGKQMGRIVQNKTALESYYDFALTWDPDQAADSLGPSIFAALREQLGLKLEAAKGPVPVLVIEHAEKPDAN
jgi:uncharacterized protein (TIGR03435 family)